MSDFIVAIGLVMVIEGLLWAAAPQLGLKLLAAAGFEVTAPDSGCCGMAGSFGFKPEHYEASIKLGESALIPAVRNASDETLIVANGFSCREQIEQMSGRSTVHLAEVLAMALKEKQ